MRWGGEIERDGEDGAEGRWSWEARWSSEARWSLEARGRRGGPATGPRRRGPVDGEMGRTSDLATEARRGGAVVRRRWGGEVGWRRGGLAAGRRGVAAEGRVADMVGSWDGGELEMGRATGKKE